MLKTPPRCHYFTVVRYQTIASIIFVKLIAETQRKINMLSYVSLIMGGSFFIHSISTNVTHFLLYLHWIYYTHVLYLHSYIRFMYIFILHNHFLLDRSIRLLHPLRLKLFTSFFRIPLRSPQKGLYN